MHKIFVTGHARREFKRGKSAHRATASMLSVLHQSNLPTLRTSDDYRTQGTQFIANYLLDMIIAKSIMRFGPLFLAVLTTATAVTAGLTPTWHKLKLGMTLAEANLNTDRTRIEDLYQTAKNGSDGNALKGAQREVADILFERFYHANTIQIMALRDLNDYLSLPVEDPATWYGGVERRIEQVDFALPAQLLETCGVFDATGEQFPIQDIPGCELCPVQW